MCSTTKHMYAHTHVFPSLSLHSLQCGGCPALSLYSLQCWGMSLGYSVIYTLHKWAKIMENSKIRIKTNASKREFQVSGPVYFSCPSSTTCQTDSQRAPWQNFWNSDRVKILFPFVLFNLPNKSDDDNEPEENFLPLRDDKTSPPKDEPEKEAKQEGQTNRQEDMPTDRQEDRQEDRQRDSQACLETFCSFSPAILGFRERTAGWFYRLLSALRRATPLGTRCQDAATPSPTAPGTINLICS